MAAADEQKPLDLTALAKQARPAVMHLTVYDADGKEIGTGTGFLVSPDGFLVTSRHLIRKAHRAVAKSAKGGLFPVAGLLAEDARADLAVLKLDAKDLPVLPLGSSAKVQAGMRVAVIGSPFGLEGTLSEGIVSAVRDTPLFGRRLIQITAAISPGSSGSPVLNGSGEVIGVATFLLKGGQSLNFAVPVERVKAVLKSAHKVEKPLPLEKHTSLGLPAIFDDPHWRAAVSAEAEDNGVELLKHAKVLVRRYSEQALAHMCLGEAYGMLGFWKDAAAAYKQAIKLNPDDPLAWGSLGVSYFWIDRRAAMRAASEQARKLHCRGPSVGRLRTICRDADEVARCIRGVKSKPQDPQAWKNLAVSYLKSGPYADAVAACREAVKLKPDFAEAWRELGVAYVLMNRYADGVAAYKHAIKLKPDFADAWYNLGFAHGKMGRRAEAIAAFRQAIKLKPDDAEAWNKLGFYYFGLGEIADAVGAYKQAIKLKPDYAEAWLNLAFAYGLMNRYADAVAAHKQVVTLNPGDAKAWYNLGLAYIVHGRQDEAREVWRKLKEIDPQKAGELEGLLR